MMPAGEAGKLLEKKSLEKKRKWRKGRRKL